jgi:hypothetical protein
MRTIILGVFVFLVSEPSFAQRLLKREPLILDPYAVVLIDDGSCSAGKILKVTGSVKGLRRKKSCIPLEITGTASARL